MDSRFSFVVYSKDACPQCEATKRVLKSADVPFTEVDAMEYREALVELGVRQAPVVELLIDGRPTLLWSGHKPSFISELLKTIPRIEVCE